MSVKAVRFPGRLHSFGCERALVVRELARAHHGAPGFRGYLRPTVRNSRAGGSLHESPAPPHGRAHGRRGGHRAAPLAASAGPAGGPENGRAADDAKSPLTHALARANKPPLPAPEDAAAHCGPELVSPEGVEAQTCVLNRGRDTWARTYYRNATGQELGSVLTLMGPDGRTLETNCQVAADDQPDSCETPHQSASGAAPGRGRIRRWRSSRGRERTHRCCCVPAATPRNPRAR